MITDDELDAHLAMITEFHRRVKEDQIARCTAAAEQATSDFMRKKYLDELEQIRAIGQH